MIIRIQASGGSFRGAGAYYLHDKQPEAGRADAGSDTGRLQGGQLKAQEKALKPTSAERVWFTETRNCMNRDPFRALDEMWGVAADQDWLKMQAGVKRGGRVCESPVKTIAMSWHRQDAPSPEHMIESAEAFLKHMGWHEHQAVVVGHDDTDHKHLHIILNRVHPDTGRTLDDYKDHKRAQTWALAYEKEHENVRCEERELRAAQREHRAPEFNDSKTLEAGVQEADRATLTRSPANDHLPHNVIMLSRPLEEQFHAEERARARDVLTEYADLKAHQREERAAHFKDGSKLFKAARNAAYDDVRKEFKAEWRQYYKDAREAGFGAANAKDKAVDDAIYAAYAADWFLARQRFDGREDLMQAAAQQFAERKADIYARQKAAIAERQKEVCDELRLVRDVQYKELLQYQRDGRAAWSAGATLESLGIAQGDAKSVGPVANQNELAASPPVAEAQKLEPAAAAPAIEAPAKVEALPEPGKTQQNGGKDIGVGADLSEPSGPPSIPGAIAPEAASLPELPNEAREVAQIRDSALTGAADLAAGAIGSLASYIADQLGEMFAPTPPEVRQAQAKAEVNAEAKREAEQPARQEPESEFDKILAAAVRSVEAERSQHDAAYWKERDRGKGWERDQ